MIKLKFVISAVLFFLAFDSICSQSKVAFVDSDIIIKQLPEAQDVQKKLEELQKLYLDTLTAKENEIKANAEVFKTKYENAQKQVESGSLKPDQIKILEVEIKQMQDELQNLDQEYSDYKQKVQEILVKTQAELFKPVKEKITKTIEQIAKELKYNVVLDKASDALIYGDKEIDITFKVLDRLK